MADMTPIKQKTIAEKKKDLDKLMGAINKKLGKNMVNYVSDPDTREKLTIKYIPFPSLRLNAMCNGLPKGRFSIISGMSDSGKTSLILETIGKAMKEDPNFVALWLESEKSLEIDALELMFGIDPTRFVYIEVTKDESAEKVLDVLENVIEVGGIDIAVINSLKCLTPKKEFADSMEDQNIGLQARLNAKFMRKITHIIAEQETALVVTQHRTTNIGQMHGDPMILAGGQAIKYASMLTLDLRRKTMQDADPISKEEGLKIGVHIEKNHCCQTKYPYLRGDYFIKFGEGTQIHAEVIELAIEAGVLTKGGGGWMTEIDEATGEAKVLPDGTVAKWQGVKKLKEYMLVNPSYYDFLKEAVLGGGIKVETMSDEEIAEAMVNNATDAINTEELDELLDEGKNTPKKSSKKSKK